MNLILVLLALLLTLSIVALTMKTLELNSSITDLTAAITALGTSIDAAVEALGKFKDVTPDADVVTAITNINAQTSTATALKAKLDAALTP